MTDTPDRPQPQPGLLNIAPYVPGKSQAAPGVTPVKLSANESPLGASQSSACVPPDQFGSSTSGGI